MNGTTPRGTSITGRVTRRQWQQNVAWVDIQDEFGTRNETIIFPVTNPHEHEFGRLLVPNELVMVHGEWRAKKQWNGSFSPYHFHVRRLTDPLVGLEREKDSSSFDSPELRARRIRVQQRRMVEAGWIDENLIRLWGRRLDDMYIDDDDKTDNEILAEWCRQWTEAIHEILG